MAVKREKIHFESVEELLGAPVTKDGTEEIRIDQIFPFENHPFKVLDDDRMQELVESIKANGVLSPVIVRPDDEGTYEMISGHRRMHAAKLAGLTTVPAIVKEMTDDEAVILMVDANIQREEILPSERAFAFKMKNEALRRQGNRTDLTSGQVVPKSDDNRTTAQIGADTGDSYKTVQRYIRLTNLIPEILQYVDEGRISFTPAVELSYLNEQEQQDLLEQIEQSDCTPSLSQACRFKKISQAEGLTPEVIAEIMEEEKANQKERIKIPTEKLREYFPKNYTVEQIENEIIKLCEKNYRNKQRDAR